MLLRFFHPCKLMALQALWASELIYVTSLFLIKCSMLCLYHRIFGTIKRTLTISLYAVSIFNLCCFIIVFFIFLFQCKPINFVWDRTIPGGHCIEFNTLCLSTGVISITTDIVILALPVPMVWSLQLSKTQKLGIIGVFFLGGLSADPYLPYSIPKPPADPSQCMHFEHHSCPQPLQS